MAIPPPALVIPPPLQQPIETEEEKLKREGNFLHYYFEDLIFKTIKSLWCGLVLTIVQKRTDLDTFVVLNP